MKGYQISYMEELGKFCKEFRIRYNITQSEIAESSGYSQSDISKFEAGKNNNAIILLSYIELGIPIQNFCLD